MSGDWIKMRRDLATDPAVIAIAAATDLEEDTVVGKLHRLWSWADGQLRDGNAPSVTGSWVDRHLGVVGFSEAMQAAGWLTIAETGIAFPNFDRHMSETAKKRALTAERVARHRKSGNARSVTNALAREEKRRVNNVRTSARACADVKVEGIELDVGAIDWAEAKTRAASYRKRIAFGPGRLIDQDRDLLLQLAAARQVPTVPDDVVESAVDAAARKKSFTSGPGAFLQGAIRRQCEEAGLDWHALQRTLRPPQRGETAGS